MTAEVDLSRWVQVPVIVFLAAVVGLAAGVDPKFAIAGAFAVAFLILVIADLMAGLIVFTFVAFLEIVPFGGPAVSFSKLLGLLLLLSWAASVGRQSAKVDKAIVRPATLILAGLLGWLALSATWAEFPSQTATTFFRLGLNAVLFVIVLTSIRDRTTILRIIAAFVVGASIAATYGLISPGQYEGQYGRLESAALDPNELAAVLVPAVLLCMFTAIGLRSRPTVRMAALGAGAICGVTLILTVSRGGLIALTVALVVAFVVGGPWRGRIGMIGLTLAASVFIYFAAYAPQTQVEHLKATTQGDARLQEGRVTIWEVAKRMAEANPVHGVGGGNFRTSTVHYLLQPGLTARSDLIVDSQLVAHNTYLEIAAELGVIGLAFYLALLGFCLGSLIKASSIFRRNREREMELYSRALFAALSGLLVADFFISDQFGKALWLLLALGPAMLVVARREASAGGADAVATR